MSIFLSLSPHITLFGKFLILGKLYFKTITFTVAIFPISNSFKSEIFDLSVTSYGKSNKRSLTFSIFLFFKYFFSFKPTPFTEDMLLNKKLFLFKFCIINLIIYFY